MFQDIQTACSHEEKIIKTVAFYLGEGIKLITADFGKRLLLSFATISPIKLRSSMVKV
jgi:hypothetical protein